MALRLIRDRWETAASDLGDSDDLDGFRENPYKIFRVAELDEFVKDKLLSGLDMDSIVRSEYPKILKATPITRSSGPATAEVIYRVAKALYEIDYDGESYSETKLQTTFLSLTEYYLAQCQSGELSCFPRLEECYECYVSIFAGNERGSSDLADEINRQKIRYAAHLDALQIAGPPIEHPDLLVISSKILINGAALLLAAGLGAGATYYNIGTDSSNSDVSDAGQMMPDNNALILRNYLSNFDIAGILAMLQSGQIDLNSPEIIDSLYAGFQNYFANVEYGSEGYAEAVSALRALSFYFPGDKYERLYNQILRAEQDYIEREYNVDALASKFRGLDVEEQYTFFDGLAVENARLLLPLSPQELVAIVNEALGRIGSRARIRLEQQ